jgi:Zn-dependent M28 family amino/carboxypeptidase
MIDEDVTASDIERHVTALIGDGPRHEDNRDGVVGALRYVTEQLTGIGFEVTVERYGAGVHEVNLLASLPGMEPDSALLELGAHWDTVAGSPGADDNASGVAGVLEAARVLSRRGRPRRGVRFCLYGGEEGQENAFRGSLAHVASLPDGAVEGAIVLEMIGYRTTESGSQRIPEAMVGLLDAPSRGDFIAAVADEMSVEYAAAVESAARARSLAVLPLVVPAFALPVVSRSDHVPYWLSGRKGLMVTDTAEYRNPHYHRVSDTVGTLDLAFAAEVSVVVTAAVAELVGPWTLS